MIGTAYILKSCNTCRRILKGVHEYGKVDLVDIKSDPLSVEVIDCLAEKAGSYEAIFNKQSIKYREKGLAHIQLEEEDYRKYIIEEYTFLKRPIFIIDEMIFIGNSNKSVTNLMNYLNMKSKQQ
nr:ArsC/Spx/MgsR family protein [uncultured Carboxylicivirga sp.]